MLLGKFARLVLGVLLVLGLVAFLGSPFFQVRHVQVVGGDAAVRQEALSAAGVQDGQNIWRINLVQIADKVHQDAWVKNVQVNRSLPSTLVIRLQLHRAVGIIFQQGKYLLVSGSGFVLGNQTGAPNLPFLTPVPGKALHTGEQVAGTQSKLCAAAAKLPAGITASEWHLRKDGSLVLYLMDGTAVRLGSGQLRQKLAVLGPILARQQQLGQRPVSVDLADPTRPVVQEAGGGGKP